MNPRSLRARVRTSRGVTLIELLIVLSIGALVLGILYMLVDVSTRGGRIVHARVSDTDQGRQVLAWVADRLRQASYDPLAACPDGLVLIGSGEGFAQRLAFRAVIDAEAVSPRRLYVFYLEKDTIWQETRVESPGAPCDVEAARSQPDPNRTALTRPIVKKFELQFLGKDGQVTAAPSAVRSIGITLRLEAASTPRRVETQTFGTSVTIRGP